MTRAVWILTRSYNDYNQHGEYFVAVFFTFPSQDELVHAGVPLGDLVHVQGGGGRRDGDHDWFELTRHQEPT